MFLNPNIRNKLILKQQFNNDMNNNPFVPSINDNTIYLQTVTESNEIKYKTVVIKGEKIVKKLKEKSNDEILEEFNDIEMLIPNKMEKVENVEPSEDVEPEDVESSEDVESEELDDGTKELFGGGDDNIKRVVVSNKNTFF